MSKVLVAEDEPALLESYSELVQALGHECVCAYDGNQALELARQHQPDLVITDYMMPGKTGIELLRALRVDPALYGVPVIILSAARPPERERRDAWLFLAKPVPIDRLELAIHEGLALSARTKKPAAGARAAPGPDTSSLSLAREDMLSWVSHEIKSPLAAALTAAELALRDARTSGAAPIEKRLMMIARQLRRMDELVTSLLDAAQLQDGRLALEREPLDVAALVETQAAYWRELNPEVSFDLSFDARPTISADPERMRQVVDNLLSNAIKYGRPANRVNVTLRVDEEAKRVRLGIADRGRGIPREELGHIFDRFHRVAGQGGRGHGLGLYIAAALTRLHGGIIEVESELGQGSTFTVVLPHV
jgi:two-component system, sensor histidine kinase and response regulator